MGISDSKPVSKKIEKTIIRCPLETTEIIASDCESTCHSRPIKPNVFSVTNLNTLSSQHSLETFSNLSYANYEYSNENKDLPKKPLIQNLNSKVELLDEGLSDQNVTFDEFSSPENSSTDTSSSNNDSTENSDSDSSASSYNGNSSDPKSDVSGSAKSHFGFNKEFMRSFKERYSGTKDGNCVNQTGDKNSRLIDGEDSFTEITNMLPNENHRKTINAKDNIKYLEDILLNKMKPNRCSKESLTNNSLKMSEISRDKQVRSMPTSKLDISSHSYVNKTSNSLTTDLSKTKPGFKSLCYKFWVDATFDTWKVFHNPRDRRIESIGRLSGCQIRLTKITQRSPKGMLKRQVYVYSSSLSALEKCCKLFDDKFPHFCASAGLSIESSVSDRV